MEFWNRLSDRYLQSENQEILDAVDSIDPIGGFATMMCGFYSEIMISEKAVKRYKASPQYIQRCSGISFRKNELEILLKQ